MEDFVSYFWKVMDDMNIEYLISIPLEAISIEINIIRDSIMESFRGQGGIQMLLSAEQDAQQVISTARNMKMARLKQAKDEAEREVAQYRAHMEAQYQNKLSETNSGSYIQRLEDETKVKIENLKESSERVSKDVVHMLLQYVASPRP